MIGRGVRMRKKAPTRGTSDAARKARVDTATPVKKILLENGLPSLLKVRTRILA